MCVPATQKARPDLVSLGDALPPGWVGERDAYCSRSACAHHRATCWVFPLGGRKAASKMDHVTLCVVLLLAFPTLLQPLARALQAGGAIASLPFAQRMPFVRL